jgi:hypothetical protein
MPIELHPRLPYGTSTHPMTRRQRRTLQLSRRRQAVTHATAPHGATVPLPLDRSLLRRVDVLAHAALEQECRHVVRQECAGLRVHHVEPVVVDQHGLLLQPVAPALLTDFLDHARSDLSGKWSAFESAARLSAARASHVRHIVWSLGDTNDLRGVALAVVDRVDPNVKCRATRTQWWRTLGTLSLTRHARHVGERDGFIFVMRDPCCGHTGPSPTR